MEKRIKENRIIEMRAVENDEGKMIVEGYAVVFEQPTEIGWYTEIIDRNAFDGADTSDIVMKYNHEDSVLPMARTRGGTLTFNVDDHGMKIRADLVDTSVNQDIYKLIRSEVLSKMSFAFSVAEEEVDYENDVRRITKFDKIFDVSVVDFPAYEETEIYARGKTEYEKEKEEYIEEKNKFELEKQKMLLSLSLEK